MEPVRLAVVGAGGIGSRHIDLAMAAPECELVSIVDPAAHTAQRAEKLGVAHFPDTDAMLETVVPEGAVIATPNTLHTSVAEVCADRGVHILVEKPIAESMSAGHRIVDVAKEAGVHLLVGHMRRFDPAIERARDMLAAGEIGRLLAVQGLWAIRKAGDYFDAAWRRQAGGGPVILNLVHDIDCLRYICGEIVSVTAETSNASRGFEVEDTAAILLRFEGGALGTFLLSDAAPSPWGWERATGENPMVPPSGENCYRFMGSSGALDFPGLALWRHDESGPMDWTQPIVRVSEAKITERASLAVQLAHFCRVIRGLESPRTDGPDGLATLAVTLAVLESALSGRPIAPGTLA